MSEPIKRESKYIEVKDIKPFERNPRRITEKVFVILVDGLKGVGQFAPVIVTSDLRMIGGHQRLKAFQKLGWEHIRVSVPDRELTDAEFKEIVIKSNTTSGTFDIDILASDFELDALVEWGIDEKLLLDAKREGEATEDDGPATPPVTPYSKPGDIWICGPHRVMCGDATKSDDVGCLLGTAKPNLCVTDPPYGVEYDANWRNEAKRPDGTAYGASAIGKVTNDAKADWREAWALFPGNIMYVWHAGKFSGVVEQSLDAAGFEVRSQIIWAKSNFAIGRGDYHWQHEPCWYAVRKGGTGDWKGDRKQSTLWSIDKPQKSETGHSTQKPIECMQRPMRNNSSEGMAIYDPFLGSGTTLIAAQQINRICLGMEINPAYVDVIVRRWQDFTHEAAVHAADGTPFPVEPKK